MSKPATEARGVRLPTLQNAPSAVRINPNCKVVSRLGEPVYPSCHYCDLSIGNCLQFQGQLHSAVIFAALVIMIAVPLPTVGRAVLAAVAVGALLSLLRRVGRESQRLILAQWNLKERSNQVERRNTIFEVTRDAEVQGARTLQSFLDRVLPKLYSTDRYVVLALTEEGEGVRVDRSGLPRDSLTALAQLMALWRAQMPAGEPRVPVHARDVPAERFIVPGGRDLREDLSGAWLAPLQGQSSDCLGSLILWPPSDARPDLEFGGDFDGAEILSAQTALLMDNEVMADSLLNRERLSTVGEMALSVAHEINNPLALIAGNRDRLARHLADLNKTLREHEVELNIDDVRGTRRMLASIGDSVERIRRTVHDMNALAGAGKEERVAIDPSASLHAAVQRFQDRVVEAPQFHLEVDPGLAVTIDPYRFDQVIDNLIENAARAVAEHREDGGWIRIRQRSNADHGVEIQIEDNGAGVPRDLVATMFNPFVTSRRAGQGSGLGLAVVKSIVESAEGSVSYREGAAGGSLFTISLPGDPASPKRSNDVTEPVPTASVGPYGGRKRILIVEDEPALRELFVSMVDEEHDVSAASNGAEALELIEQDDGDFDIVLCDLMMPVMSGAELLEQCQIQFPDVADRIVFSTGGATEPELVLMLRERMERGFPVLQKPFGMSEFLAVIEAVSVPRTSGSGQEARSSSA